MLSLDEPLPVVAKFLHSRIGERVGDHIEEYLWDSNDIMCAGSQGSTASTRVHFCDWRGLPGNAADPSVYRCGLWKTGIGVLGAPQLFATSERPNLIGRQISSPSKGNKNGQPWMVE